MKGDFLFIRDEVSLVEIANFESESEIYEWGYEENDVSNDFENFHGCGETGRLEEVPPAEFDSDEVEVDYGTESRKSLPD